MKYKKIFLADLGHGELPYMLVELNNGEEWLCYYNKGSRDFITYRPVKENETFPDNLTSEEQELYINLQESRNKLFSAFYNTKDSEVQGD